MGSKTCFVRELVLLLPSMPSRPSSLMGAACLSFCNFRGLPAQQTTQPHCECDTGSLFVRRLGRGCRLKPWASLRDRL